MTPRKWIRLNYLIMAGVAALAGLNAYLAFLLGSWFNGAAAAMMVGMFVWYIRINRNWRNLEAKERQLNADRNWLRDLEAKARRVG